MNITQAFKIKCDVTSCNKEIQIDIEVNDITVSRDGKIEFPMYAIQCFLEENDWSYELYHRYYGGHDTYAKCPIHKASKITS